MTLYHSALILLPHENCWKQQGTAVCWCQLPRCPRCGKPEHGTIDCEMLVRALADLVEAALDRDVATCQPTLRVVQSRDLSPQEESP